jgi:hypothetical protein
VEAWSEFFLFFPCVLRQHRIRGGKRRRHQPLAYYLASSLSRWEGGDIAGLWDEAREAMARRPHMPQSSNSSRIRRVKQLVRERRFGKAASALTSEGFALPSDDVVRALESKHPVRDEPWVPPTPPIEASTFHSSEVKQALLSFPNGTAGGSSGCLAQHLKDCLDCRAPQIAGSFLSSLRDVVNVLSKGLAPTSIACSLAGGKLVALNKKGVESALSVLERFYGDWFRSFSVVSTRMRPLVSSPPTGRRWCYRRIGGYFIQPLFICGGVWE